MIVLAFDGESNEAIAEQVGCERHIVGVWRRRWAQAFERLGLGRMRREALGVAADAGTVLERFATQWLGGEILRGASDTDHRYSM